MVKDHQGTILGINASRNKSGGAVAYIKGILESEYFHQTFDHVHIWAHARLAKEIPISNKITIHTPNVLNKSILKQLFWEFFYLKKTAKSLGISIMFNTDAGTVCNFRPYVVMSQDMLSYEPGEINRYGFTLSRLRLLILKYSQLYSIKNANGVIFLSNYAKKIISSHLKGPLKLVKVIPHGINNSFRIEKNFYENLINKKEIIITYVSNAAMYKHQWHVIEAVSNIRSIGINIKLKLIGGGSGKPQALIDKYIKKFDLNKQFVTQLPFINNNDVPMELHNSDIFLFASSCENLPVTLLEGMASGLPIVCSNRGPMPEIVGNGGIYFNPENPLSIEEAIKKVIYNNDLRNEISLISLSNSKFYSWNNCAKETFLFLKEVQLANKNIKN